MRIEFLISLIIILNFNRANSDSFTPNFSTHNFLGPDFSAPVNPILLLIRFRSPISPTNLFKPLPKPVLIFTRFTTPNFLSLFKESLNNIKGLKNSKILNKVSRKRKRDIFEKDTFNKVAVVPQKVRRFERLIMKVRK